MDLTAKLDNLLQLAINYAPKVVLALVVLFVGLWIIGNIVQIAGNAMAKSEISDDIRPFLQSLLSVGLKVLLLFSVAGMVGIETTSFVAVLAAAGFAVGMALQGSLSNFAAGVIILLFKPYRVGDLVEIQEKMGYIREIQIVNTIIETLDSRTCIVPNSIAISDVITNLSTQKVLRVDLNVYMPYSEDFEKVKAIILENIKNTPKVLHDPETVVGIEEFDSHSIKLAIWTYCLTDDYWDVFFAANANIKKALGSNHIKVAYSEGVEMGDIGL